MKRFSIILSLLCLCLLATSLRGIAGERPGVQKFVISGNVSVPDGYVAGLCVTTDTAFSVMLGETTVKNGRFTISGTIDHPLQGMLTTNNLELVEKNHWPMDSIHWTYTDVFVTQGDLSFDLVNKLTGTEVQRDYNEWLGITGEGLFADSLDSYTWQFIDKHPQSVVSVWLANDLLKRGYNLTTEQVEHLEKTITGVPLDTMRMAEFHQRIAYAKKTTKGGKLLDLELLDTKGNVCHLVDVVKSSHDNGEVGSGPKTFVLIDFWASWCGICIASMPEIAEIAKEYEGKLSVIAVSIDKKDEAWRKAMKQHPEPWPQYMTSEKGYKDLFEKYQVGNGVPYYIILTPDGNVLNSPSTPDAVREIMQKYN